MRCLGAAGWVVHDYRLLKLKAGVGVAVRELVTAAGPAGHTLFVNREAVGGERPKTQRLAQLGVAWQTLRYRSDGPGELRTYVIGGWFGGARQPLPTASPERLIASTGVRRAAEPDLRPLLKYSSGRW